MKLPLVTVPAQAENLRLQRECGSCTACCVLPRIIPDEEALPLLPEGKPGYSPCTHLCSTGCSQYENRPPVCREFMCLWRSGHIEGDERRRPDKLGLMATLETWNGRFAIELWEMWEGAASDHPGRALVDALAGRFIIAIRYYGIPCSLEYNGPTSLANGKVMSELGKTDPKKLALLLCQLIEKRLLAVPEKRALVDLESLERGEPIQPYYKRGDR